jgi:hypothetical protein
MSQAMANPIARRPGLVKCDQMYIRASRFSDKNTICVIRGLVTSWQPNFGLVHFKIICQALVSLKKMTVCCGYYGTLYITEYLVQYNGLIIKGV